MRTESNPGGDHDKFIFQSSQSNLIGQNINSMAVRDHGSEKNYDCQFNSNLNPSVDPSTAKQTHESILNARKSTLKHITSVEDEIM